MHPHLRDAFAWLFSLSGGGAPPEAALLWVAALLLPVCLLLVACLGACAWALRDREAAGDPRSRGGDDDEEPQARRAVHAKSNLKAA